MRGILLGACTDWVAGAPAMVWTGNPRRPPNNFETSVRHNLTFVQYRTMECVQEYRLIQLVMTLNPVYYIYRTKQFVQLFMFTTHQI